MSQWTEFFSVLSLSVYVTVDCVVQCMSLWTESFSICHSGQSFSVY
jgi:uncharacterized membrane protein (DUF2068 family)